MLLRPRAGLIAAFGVIVAALAIVVVLVWVAVEPQLQSLRDIANDHARAVQVTTGIRARISTARRDLLAIVSGDARDDPARTFDRLIYESEALRPLADTAAERADLDALQEALARCRGEALGVVELVRSGDVERARARIEAFVELTRNANEAADQIVSFNATEVEQLSRRIRLDLRWSVVATTALMIVGAAAALILLVRALRGLAAEDALSRARWAELEAFAARAAHELRTPLQGVSLALAALERGSNPPMVDSARRSAERLRDTVDGLLEFARAGSAPAGVAAADVACVIADVQEELAPELGASRGGLQVDVPHGMSVSMGATHLGTVIRNLLGNALKYAGDGAGARVTVRASKADGVVRLEVVDDGPGIAPNALPRVFEPFFRATTSKAGHGLGLATVRRLVEAHGGNVRIASEPGRGTTVTVELPAPFAENR